MKIQTRKIVDIFDFQRSSMKRAHLKHFFEGINLLRPKHENQDWEGV